MRFSQRFVFVSTEKYIFSKLTFSQKVMFHNEWFFFIRCVSQKISFVNERNSLCWLFMEQWNSIRYNLIWLLVLKCWTTRKNLASAHCHIRTQSNLNIRRIVCQINPLHRIVPHPLIHTHREKWAWFKILRRSNECNFKQIIRQMTND